MNTDLKIDPRLLRGLAPDQLTMYRSDRYSGEDLGVSCADLAAADQQFARLLYAGLMNLLQYADPLHRSRSALSVDEALVRIRWPELLGLVTVFGHQTRALDPPRRVRQAVHDIKGGALTSLIFWIKTLDSGADAESTLGRGFFLVRDHLKIMRNCLADLDSPARQRDLEEKHHAVELLREKWEGAVHRVDGGEAHIAVHGDFDGVISSRCMEFSTLDRVLYNLINNAAKHAADQRVDLVVMPTPPEDPRNLRFVVLNRTTLDHRNLLRSRFRDSINGLFQEEFTTGGSGVGLSICADLVGNAFGVPDPIQGLDDGYLGAAWIEDRLATWFHWPILR
jgi:signal transduction histidine kinase